MTIHFNGYAFSEIHALGNDIVEVYHGTDLVWSKWKDLLLTTPGLQSNLRLPAGYYSMLIHGAGGAGGTNGLDNTATGGDGGAGGTGDLTSELFKVTTPKRITAYVGEKGYTLANGGNGGTGGTSGYTSGAGGDGGGGGEPSYVVWDTTVYSANGGGGGGGGGGCGTGGVRVRYAYGGGGGGGGGYYRLAQQTVLTRAITIYFCEQFGTEWYKLSETPGETPTLGSITIANNTQIQVGDEWTVALEDSDVLRLIVVSIDNGAVEFDGVKNGSEFIGFDNLTVANLATATLVIESVPGKNGGNRGNAGQDGQSGTAGNTTDFPNIFSGRGGGYGSWLGGHDVGSAGANGGGASGAGGGSEGGNTDYSWGGAAGGGAGGSLDAGGGKRGSGHGSPTDAYNPHTVPTSTTDYRGQTVSEGWGVGGAVGENGSDGWIYISRLGRIIRPDVMDLGLLSTADPQSLDNAGTITGIIAESDDAGSITGTVSDTDDAGTIYTPVPATPWVLGSITDTVSETTNCGNIM